MSGNFDVCLPITLSYEGGNDNDRRDPGGRTSRGITEHEWSAYLSKNSGRALPEDVWRAPQSDIIAIYRTEYWNPVAGDRWPIGLNLCVFDAGVNSGLGRALAWARATLAQREGAFLLLATAAAARGQSQALVHEYQKRRLSFLEALRTWRYFGRGWARRVAGIESIAIRWILHASGAPREVVTEILNKKAAQAKTKSTTAAGGAVAAPAAPVAHNQLVQHSSWLHDAVDIGLIMLTCAVVAWLVYQAYIHAIRSQAFAGAAK